MKGTIVTEEQKNLSDTLEFIRQVNTNIDNTKKAIANSENLSKEDLLHLLETMVDAMDVLFPAMQMQIEIEQITTESDNPE